MSLSRGSAQGRDFIATLDKSEIRRRARAFAKSWSGATSEQADKQPFWDEFFGVFGVRRRQVATYEAIAKRASTGRHGWIDLLLSGHMGGGAQVRRLSLKVGMAQLID
jgi:hypothetical protein